MAELREQRGDRLTVKVVRRELRSGCARRRREELWKLRWADC